MSEKQVHMGKRLIEILDEMGHIEFSRVKYPTATITAMITWMSSDVEKEKGLLKQKLAQTLTEAITIFEAEEIEKEMLKLRQSSTTEKQIK